MRRGRILRTTGAGAIGCLVAVVLVACGSSAPTEDELAGAEAARSSGAQALAGIEVPTPTGWEQIAERNVDACGSTTDDRGGFDDAHVNGYSCSVIRRTLYARSDGAPTSRDDEAAWAAVAEISDSFAEQAREQESPGLHLSDRVPNASGVLILDDNRVRIEAFVQDGQSTDIDVVPLWHRNETIVTDEAKLVAQLEQQGRSDEEVLQVTLTVPYFASSRDEEQE